MPEKQKVFSKIFTAALALMLAAQVILMLLPGFGPGGAEFHLTAAALEAVLALGASAAGADRFDGKKILRLLFTIYSIHLIGVLFFDGSFGRTPGGARAEWFLVNLTPFATIANYWVKWRQGLVGTRVAVTNLLGNILAFAPMGVLLPLIGKKPWGFLETAFTGAALIALAEVLQWYFGVGSCDIDDFILNFAGLLAARACLCLPCFRKTMGRKTPPRGKKG